MRRKTIFCKHYRAMYTNDTCDAGVSYDSFKGMKYEDRPCFCRNGQQNAGCSLMVFPTAEELAAEDEYMRKRFESMGKAREAIVASLGGPWKRGMMGVNGVIDCPACGGEKSLRFSRAGCNGHIHASCSTDDCVSWME